MVSKPNEVHFSVDSQLIGELGERLVTKNHVALSELIKNAFDADAKKVRIYTKLIPDIKNERLVQSVVVEDDGAGMSLAEVKAHWMRIATSNKSREPVSRKFGRTKTGNKGIGRFSCQRLARQLRLITTQKVKDGYRQTEVDFVWSDFVPGKELSEVPCEYRTRRVAKAKAGTRLELIELRDDWNNRDWFTLRRTVTALAMVQDAKRSGFSRDPGFSIVFDVPGVEGLSGNLREQVLDAGWGRITGGVDSEGKVSFELEGKFLPKKQTHQLPNHYPGLRGLRLEMSWINRGWREDLVDMNRNRRVLSSKVLAEFAEEAGIRVYDNGFRVFPFGEKGNDWLDLDRDYARRFSGFHEQSLRAVSESIGLSARDVGLLRPRSDNLIGSVFVASKSMDLETNMDREGFIKNKAFDELQTVVKAAVEFMAVHYAYAKTLKEAEDVAHAVEEFDERVAKTKRAKPPSMRETVQEAIKFISSTAKTTAHSSVGVERQVDTEAAIESAERVLTSQYVALDSELSILRAIGSAAPLLFMFSHEVNGLLDRLDGNAMMLEGLISEEFADETNNAMASAAKQLRETSASFSQMIDLFGIVARAKVDSPKRVKVLRIVEAMVSGTRYSTSAAGINVTIDVDEFLRTPKMREAELISLIANMYSNALKSVYSRGSGKIRISASDEDGEFSLKVWDTGVGLEEKYWGEVTKPFVSDPAGQIYVKLDQRFSTSVGSALGRGTGLGLSIVKGIVDAYSGTLKFSSPKGWSFCVEVAIPI